MKNKGKWVQSLALIVTSAMVLAACGSKEAATTTTAPAATAAATATATPAATAAATSAAVITPETKDVTLVGVRDAQISSQQIIADKLGYFKEAGLNVTSQLIESGPDIGPMVAGGSAPVSIQTNFMDIILKSSNVPVKIVAPLAQIAGTQAVVGSKKLELKSAKDLEGKTIGIPNGADVKIAIDNMGKELGVDVSKIKYVNLAPSDAVVALQKGDIDAMACWEPFITKAIQGGGKFLFSGTKSELPDKKGNVNWMSVHTTIQVSDDYIKKNPNTIKAILAALKKATDYININRKDAIKILAPELHLSEEELTQIMDRNVYAMVVDDTYVNGSNGAPVGDYLKAVGNIKTVPKADSYHDLSLLKAVDPGLIKVELK
ncbi:ABC transporter substrate-binding protein [Paenibacillus sp. GCM10027628]|uniref:ABC transporter substrate-binding protein n=1 Tax=Paenibacillus sp. GCM10027628 TaxID=3273413 RepID=UPI00362B9865